MIDGNLMGIACSADWRADHHEHTKSLIEKPLTLRNGTNEILVVFISRAGTSFTVDHEPRGDAVRVISMS